MKITSTSLKENIEKATTSLRRYSVPAFLLFLLAIYGFLGWRIVSLNQVEPDQAAVTAQLKTAGVPRIDPDALSKIQQLQDNSVEVKTLFDQARSNPFQE
jgi:predicted negative regulator of RcsB-dependent stress response